MNYPIRKNLGFLNVLDFGADPTGATDSSDAFLDAYTYAVNSDHGLGIHNADKISRITIAVPTGKFLINKPGSLMKSGVGDKQVGANFRGTPNSVIIWDGPDDTYLMENDRHVGMVVENLIFESANPASHFMRSDSTTTVVGLMRFNGCRWRGNWARGFHMFGGNLNSDNIWESCRISGTFTEAFLDVPAATGSDQEIIHDFYSCSIWMGQNSTFARMGKGGDISIRSGSLIALSDGVLFFDLIGNAHGQGSTNLLIDSVHVELKRADSRMINCDWETGNILFHNIDESANTSAVVNGITHRYAIDAAGPTIKYDNCRLAGDHEYRFGSGSHAYDRRIVYESCEFLHHVEPREAITTSVVGGVDLGSLAPIDIDLCSGKKTLANSIFETSGTLNWSVSSQSPMKRRAVAVNTPQGMLPALGGTTTVKLPLGALIIGVIWKSGAGSMTSTNTSWAMSLETGELIPTVLDTLSPGTPLADGYEKRVQLCFIADSDDKRTITVTSDANKNESSPSEICIVEYYG